MYISLNFICNNEMRPFTLISLHFNHLEMKTMNSFESAFEPFSSEYCWGNCLDQCHAGSAKAAIEGMSRHLAVEWGPDGIRVDYVAPGAVKDTEGFCRQGGKHLPPNFIENVPLQRLVSCQDVADKVYSFWLAVLQLLSLQTHWW
ncbi:unnamed protein product [Pocillopora meandrina]|uniref:Peroxisomal 2,4-dienoyl-CoA reductase [(3E)-enoyl-CoA-producing] n=1 Tax=Pocillopora meandrina TaxID=46732 RepID=A0AAU9VXJ8_9CNID|nr:unnamed protein product [Pocillopora meandrina]